MMVRDSLQAVLAKPEGPFLGPTCLAGGTKGTLTGKRQQPFVAAFRAPNAGKTAQGITTIKELPDNPLGNRPQSPEGVLILLLVGAEKGLPVILEKSIEGAGRKPARSIGHDRMSGGRVTGGVESEGGVSGE